MPGGTGIAVGAAWRLRGVMHGVLPHPLPAACKHAGVASTHHIQGLGQPSGSLLLAVSAAATVAVPSSGLCDDAILSPSLATPAEAPRYKTARVGSVHPVVRRKWSWREGSVTAEEKEAEEAEQAEYPSQEALIAALYKLA